MTFRLKVAAPILALAVAVAAVMPSAHAAPPKDARPTREAREVDEDRAVEKEKERPARSPAKQRAMARLRAILAKEPSAQEVQTATLRFYKLEPARIARMETAARLKGLVPEIEAGLDNSIANSYTNTKDGLYPSLVGPADDPNPNHYKERSSTASDLFLWRVRAVWSLDRLVFNSEALDVKSLTSIEEALVREVTTLYFSRRRALAAYVLSQPADEEEAYYDWLRIEEMTSTLDALSGGMFGPRAWKGDAGESVATETP